MLNKFNNGFSLVVESTQPPCKRIDDTTQNFGNVIYLKLLYLKSTDTSCKRIDGTDLKKPPVLSTLSLQRSKTTSSRDVNYIFEKTEIDKSIASAKKGSML